MTPTTISCPRCPRGLLLYAKPERMTFIEGGWPFPFSETWPPHWECPLCKAEFTADDLLTLKRQNKLVQMPTAMRGLMPSIAALAVAPRMRGGR